jgi:hypothetical protein
MKSAIKTGKVAFGTAKFAKIKNVRYLSWEDAFDVEFEDSLCILDAALHHPPSQQDFSASHVRPLGD